MLSVRLRPDIEKRLNQLSEDTHRSKSYYAAKAIERFLEDEEDYLQAVAIYERIKEGKEKTYTLEEIQKRLGLKNE